MAEVKFNKSYKDLELDKKVEAGEPIEMTVKRADEIVSKIKAQSDKFEGYEDFDYERLDKPETDKKKDEEGK